MPSLDAYDLKILKKLLVDGRITWSDLAEDLGLSLTPLSRSISMEEMTFSGLSALRPKS